MKGKWGPSSSSSSPSASYKSNFKYTPPAKAKEDKVIKAEVLQPGLVVFKNVIPFDIQQKIIDECIKIGEGKEEGVGSFYEGKISMKDGFHNPDQSDLLYSDPLPSSPQPPSSSSSSSASDTSTSSSSSSDSSVSYPLSAPSPSSSSSSFTKISLNMANKARITVPIEHISKLLASLYNQYLEQAHKASSSIPLVEPTMVVLNYYTLGSKIGWHSDRVVGVPMDQQHLIVTPVLSISVGHTGEFVYKNHGRDTEKVVMLESGDVLVFGGESRMILHSVSRIVAGSCPKRLNMHGYNGRFNLTFREM